MKLRRFIADRPWIWLVLLYLTLTAGVLSFVWIAIKHQQPSVPLETQAQ